MLKFGIPETLLTMDACDELKPVVKEAVVTIEKTGAAVICGNDHGAMLEAAAGIANDKELTPFYVKGGKDIYTTVRNLPMYDYIYSPGIHVHFKSEMDLEQVEHKKAILRSFHNVLFVVDCFALTSCEELLNTWKGALCGKDSFLVALTDPAEGEVILAPDLGKSAHIRAVLQGLAPVTLQTANYLMLCSGEADEELFREFLTEREHDSLDDLIAQGVVVRNNGRLVLCPSVMHCLKQIGSADDHHSFAERVWELYDRKTKCISEHLRMVQSVYEKLCAAGDNGVYAYRLGVLLRNRGHSLHAKECLQRAWALLSEENAPEELCAKALFQQGLVTLECNQISEYELQKAEENIRMALEFKNLCHDDPAEEGIPWEFALGEFFFLKGEKNRVFNLVKQQLRSLPDDKNKRVLIYAGAAHALFHVDEKLACRYAERALPDLPSCPNVPALEGVLRVLSEAETMPLNRRIRAAEALVCILENTVEQIHPKLCVAYINTADLLREGEEPNKAYDYLKKALFICERLTAPNCWVYSIIYHRLSLVAHILQLEKESCDYLYRELSCSNWVTYDAKTTRVEMYESLAKRYVQLGDDAGEQRCLIRALRILCEEDDWNETRIRSLVIALEKQ